MGAQHSRQQPGQDRLVGPVQLWPGDLAAEHYDLMTEHPVPIAHNASAAVGVKITPSAVGGLWPVLTPAIHLQDPGSCQPGWRELHALN